MPDPPLAIHPLQPPKVLFLSSIQSIQSINPSISTCPKFVPRPLQEAAETAAKEAMEAMQAAQLRAMETPGGVCLWRLWPPGSAVAREGWEGDGGLEWMDTWWISRGRTWWISMRGREGPSTQMAQIDAMLDARFLWGVGRRNLIDGQMESLNP